MKSAALFSCLHHLMSPSHAVFPRRLPCPRYQSSSSASLSPPPPPPARSAGIGWPFLAARLTPGEGGSGGGGGRERGAAGDSFRRKAAFIPGTAPETGRPVDRLRFLPSGTVGRRAARGTCRRTRWSTGEEGGPLLRPASIRSAGSRPVSIPTVQTAQHHTHGFSQIRSRAARQTVNRRISRPFLHRSPQSPIPFLMYVNAQTVDYSRNVAPFSRPLWLGLPSICTRRPCL